MRVPTLITNATAHICARSLPRANATEATIVPTGALLELSSYGLCRDRGSRHEMPVDNELSRQNIQDRYHGRNDPVAKKIMSTHAANMGLQPPEDVNVVRLCADDG